MCWDKGLGFKEQFLFCSVLFCSVLFCSVLCCSVLLWRVQGVQKAASACCITCFQAPGMADRFVVGGFVAYRVIR